MLNYMNSNNPMTTKRYLPNAEIPSICFNPVAANFLNKYVPVPNQAQHWQRSAAGTLYCEAARNDYDGLARIEFMLGRHTLDARYYKTSVNDITSNSVSQGQGIANYAQDLNTGGLTFAGVADTWVLSANTLNILRGWI